ncbi:anti-sigma factor antagonist [Actinomadura sp. DC4]|uniref:anti-sigma factor antagonist n=1 Tax=Actinomadura sp. DC4 TaxID=3055069 RepID=UPI0025B26176|nr:anti-sigma factor antagonist [Actinomadura sp. DC4]MDN3359216.1 anti-sigma factor antagonist [Actinomadura sp. DC4]
MDIALEMAVVECSRYVLAMPRGEIDAYTESTFRQQLSGAIGPRPLIIDMTEVSFFDCSALKVVMDAERQCRDLGSSLAVAGLRPGAEQVCRLARVGEIVPLCHTVQEAVWCVVPLTDEEIALWT